MGIQYFAALSLYRTHPYRQQSRLLGYLVIGKAKGRRFACKTPKNTYSSRIERSAYRDPTWCRKSRG
jgi:hypothetical protein